MLLSEYIEANRKALEQSFYYSICKKPNDVPDEFEVFCMDDYVRYSRKLLQNFKLAYLHYPMLRLVYGVKIKNSFCCDLWLSA